MNCPRCNYLLEPGVAFCGNCGLPLQPVAPNVSGALIAPGAQVGQAFVADPAKPPIAPIAPQAAYPQPQAPAVPFVSPYPQPQQQPLPPQPTFGTAPPAYGAPVQPNYGYAPVSQPQPGDTKAILALVFGCIGILTSLLFAFLGLIFGVVAIILGTLSRHSRHRGVSTAGIIVGIVSILAGLVVVSFNVSHLAKSSSTNKRVTSTTPSQATSEVSTPCYTLSFANKLNVQTTSGSCDMTAFNGATLDQSSNAYKVLADTTTAITKNNIVSVSKPILEKDVQSSFPGFTITDESGFTFADSPGYYVTASHDGVTVVEAAVEHDTSQGSNLFVLVHAGSGTVNLNDMEDNWQWK